MARMAKQKRNRRPAVRTPLSDRINELLDGRRQPWLVKKSGVRKSKIADILKGTAKDLYATEAILVARSFDMTVEELYRMPLVSAASDSGTGDHRHDVQRKSVDGGPDKTGTPPKRKRLG